VISGHGLSTLEGSGGRVQCGGGGFDRAAPKVFKGEANVAVGLDKLWRWDAHTTWHLPDPSGVAAVPT
jgi:hypothetical protein